MFIIGLINNPVTGSQPNWQICEFVSPCTREQELLWIQDKMWKIQYVGVLSSLLSMCSVSDLDYFVNKEWNKKKHLVLGCSLISPFSTVISVICLFTTVYRPIPSRPALPVETLKRNIKWFNFVKSCKKTSPFIALLKNIYFLIGSPIFGSPYKRDALKNRILWELFWEEAWGGYPISM